MTTITDEPCRFSIHGSEDFLSLIPYLLGYQPDERLVFVVLDGRRLALTGALPLDALREPEQARQSLLSATERFTDPWVMLACWSQNPDLAEEALGMAEVWVGPENVLDSVSVQPDDWHSRSGEGEGRRGRTAELANTSAAAQAVVAGLVALPSREAAVSSVAGPGEETAAADERRCLDAEDRLAALDWPAWDAAARDLHHELLVACRDGQPIGDQDLAGLAVFSGEVNTLDRYLLSIGRRTAVDCANLWARVVAQTPDDWAHGPLMMLGFSAWVKGDGAVMVACIERARRINRSSVWINTLDQMNRHAVPPQLWEEMRAREVYGLPGPQAA